jgi:hypothetical protein
MRVLQEASDHRSSVTAARLSFICSLKSVFSCDKKNRRGSSTRVKCLLIGNATRTEESRRKRHPQGSKKYIEIFRTCRL